MVSKNITLLKWYNFFYDFRPYEVIAVLYYAQITGSFTLGLAVFAVASVAAAVFEVPTGILSDRLGRKKTIIFGSITSVIAISLYALGGSFVMLALGAIFNGLTRALMSGNNDALLYDTLKQEDKTNTFSAHLGKVNSMFEVGLGISALLGGLIALISLQLVMVASILPQIICALISLRFVDPKVQDKEMSGNIYDHLVQAVRAFTRNARLRKLSMAHILDYGIEETHFQFKPAFSALLWPAWALGITRALDHIFGFLGFHFAGKIMAKYGAIKTLLGQQILGRLNIFVVAGFPSVLSPILLPINAFFFGVGSTASQSLMQQEFTDKQRATMGSLNSLGGSLFYALVSIGAGVAADKFGPAKTMVILGVLSLVVVWIYASLAFRQGRGSYGSSYLPGRR